MSTQHRVPMTPEELPQQRLVPVVTLPELPAGIDIKVVFLRATDLEKLPKEPSLNRWFVASVEWAWSPMNNRQDHYYLSRDDKGWYLWIAYMDDLEQVDFESDEGYISLQPTWYLLAHCNAANLSIREVALHLLRAFLDDDRRGQELDRFHFIADLGELSAGDLHAIAREVWRVDDDEDDEEEKE